MRAATLVLVAVLLLTACGEVIQFPSGGDGKNDGVMHTVTYRVIGGGGVLAANVEYYRGTKAVTEPVLLNPPWVKTVTVDDLDEAYLIATGRHDQLGTITCEIHEGTIDETSRFSLNTSKRGVNPVATCT